MLRRVGPDWFQELSPNQMNAVDDLPDSVKMDTEKNVITGTQQCLAGLGLVLRPNRHHVAIALKSCCQNPVEFLLILYQLMRPNRKYYTINDRLLLSAVVHLSMRSVLRELHIRIPSPPRQQKPPQKKLPKKKPYIKYKSPYLVPYTFTPEPPKHTGVYKNRHVQRPESQYFSYLDELKEELRECTRIEPTFEEGLPSKRKKFGVSYKLYQMNEADSVMTTLDKEIDEELIAAQKKYNRLAKDKCQRKLLRPSVYRTCENTATLFDSRKKNKECTQENSSKCCGEDTTTLTEETGNVEEHYEIVGTNFEYMENIQKSRRKYIIMGITITKDGTAIPIIGGVEPGSIMDCKCLRKKLVGASGQEGKDLQIICECKCEEKEKEKERQIEELLKGHGKCTCGPISVNDSSSSTVTIHTTSVGSFVKTPLEEWDKGDGKEKLLEMKKPKPFVCGCKQMVDIALECVQKKLESEETEEKMKPTLIIADTKLVEEEKPVPIIAGVKSEAKCQCLEKYKRKIEKFEDLIIKKEVQDKLKSVDQKFLISGVTTGPDGKPIYILSGAAQKRPCMKCEEMIEWKKREEERIANMPDTSQLGQRFVIGGVHHSPIGNVYVVTGVLPTKDCECMKLYNAFMDKHGHCMEIYEKYIQKMKKETDEYLSEMTEDEHEFTSENATCIESGYPEVESSSNGLSEEIKGLDSMHSECDQQLIECLGEEEPDLLFECLCNEFEQEQKPDEQEEEEEDYMDLKRFIVLDKIPCNLRDQMRILKRALRAMARDGFPLAKLPDAHRLPHFKLWMAMRCGKCWTMEDRNKLYFLSKYYWHHLDYCQTIIKSPRLPMSNQRAWQYTWASAKYIKRITNAVIEHHCRKAKQGIIDDGREFFPSMFDYELPTKTFRDCYFAYVPGKEEAVFSNRPWKDFEFVNYKLIRNKKTNHKCLR